MTTQTRRRAFAERSAIALGIVVLLVVPWIVGGYAIYLFNLVGVFSLVAIGLNLLTGYAGQISLGHSAFFAIGAYATALLTQKTGLPFWIALPAAGGLAMTVGALVALPALRLKNLYLAIATLGFGVVTQKLIFEWRSVTGGGGGLEVLPPRIGDWVLSSGNQFYYVILAAVCLGTWAASNIVKLRTGRAMLMLRESEVAAGCLGIGIARHKVTAFALSAFYTAIAGGLYCFLVRYINPESFSIGLSIMFLAMIVIGGLGTIPGSILGASFYVLVPELFRGIKDAPGLIFGLSLVVVMILLPKGLWGVSQRLRRSD
jgi:branched-chain amino acid transport system permease protein